MVGFLEEASAGPEDRYEFLAQCYTASMTKNRGCLFALIDVLLGEKPASSDLPDTDFPYAARRFFFSKAERSFYGVLQQCVPVGYVLFAKVRLADVVRVNKGTQKRQAALNRITSKHVDFLVCDEATVSPRLVIELDDSSHQKADRRQRDEFVDTALQVAGIPIMRVPVRQGYNTNALAEEIQTLLSE